MALNGPFCADVSLRNYSLTHSLVIRIFCRYSYWSTKQRRKLIQVRLKVSHGRSSQYVSFRSKRSRVRARMRAVHYR